MNLPSNLFQKLLHTYPSEPGSVTAMELKDHGQQPPIMVDQGKSGGHMDIPPPVVGIGQLPKKRVEREMDG